MARSEPCAICGGNSGLFGYAIKDGFICPACLEKAGLQKAAFSNPAGGYSSSQLREMISVRERRIAAGPQAVSPDELRTAEQMYSYYRDFKMGQGLNQKWGLRFFSLVADMLRPEEKVYTVFEGLRNYRSSTEHDGAFVFAITSQRIIMAQQQRFGMDEVKTVSLQNINDIMKKVSFSRSFIEIDTTKELINVCVAKHIADRIIPLVHYAVDQARKDAKAADTPQPAPQSAAAPSLTDELLKYKQLLDAGAITEAEYAALKSKLLGI